ncbi:MAG: HD-GYP domain-containing protein [Acidimicrobiia bacterium]|nr:HD-GYP domain-containing protein [Acidimicrobiia bacterium]MBT8249615.1 HD-GYP domain-containing protein [Acidimicrobiia bacterium]NNC42585.1 HD-GYP domain-containing protein [Acidimicrobiia bacterium]NND13752.1 HD-GYP domain-containing protein [Acidimicrobiia bacterium]NNL27788.1 HD-GYP domain-containing protein [Acidimicrobiia bacterium]
MLDDSVALFLSSLRRASSSVQLYPHDHPLVAEAAQGAVTGALALTEDEGEVVLSVVNDAFYLNKRLLPQASLEHRAMLVRFQDQGISSLTMKHPVTAADVIDLGEFLNGSTGDVPADASIALNERPFTEADLRQAANMSKLKRSYASSIDILRGVAAAAGEKSFDLNPAVWAVEELLESVLKEPGASLLLATLKGHDEYTFFHSVNTAILALAVGRTIDLDNEKLTMLGLGALLHDIGKVRVSPSVIQYPGRLTNSHWQEIKLHPQEGAQAILAASGNGREVAARVAFEHHARYDLSGYPQVRGRNNLHLFSRIVSVCDVYDAMTTRRSYKRAEPPTRALQLLLNGAGTQFDPNVVYAFIHMMGIYPTGSLLKLKTGQVVIVLDNGEDSRTPIAAVVRDSRNMLLDQYEAFELDPTLVADQVLPEVVGINPAALLEDIHLPDKLAS